MKTEHTEGPWEIDSNDRPIVINGVNQDGPDCVCTIPVAGAPFTYAYTQDVAEANARLIAAAPDLLAALQKLEVVATRLLAGGYNHQMAKAHRLIGEYTQEARAAISKATGGEK